jgi:hypothetical protein
MMFMILAYGLYSVLKQFTMQEDINNSRQMDEERISLLEECEIQNWSERFMITPEELKRAIIDVGNKVKVVEEFIKRG